MGQHKAEKLSYQTQLLQQMRQINKERVLQLQTSENKPKNFKNK